MDEKFTLSTAIVCLQSKAASFELRLNSLRFIQSYLLDSSNVVDVSTRSRINHLIMDNVVMMVLGEDRTIDIRKRQLIRTECFLILSSLLSSDALFGTAIRSLENAQDNYGEENSSFFITGQSQELIPSTISLTSPKKKAELIAPTNNNDKNTNNKLMKRNSYSANGARLLSKTAVPLTSRSIPKSTCTTSSSTTIRHSKREKETLLGKSLDFPILKSVIEKSPHRAVARKKYLRPRLSVIYGPEYEAETLAPGVEPTDWQMQDKKLGYQKYRTWFPIVPPAFAPGLLPRERPTITQSFGPNTVLEEYLQMKAMLTYVGDLVMPKRQHKLAIGFPKKDEAQYVENKKYNEAVQEAVRIWTPLVGVHLPKSISKNKVNWAPSASQTVTNTSNNLHREESFATTSSASNAVTEGNLNTSKFTIDGSNSTTLNNSDSKPLLRQSSTLNINKSLSRRRSSYGEPIPTPAPAVAPRDKAREPSEETTQGVMFTKGILRRLLKRELFCKNQTKQTLRRYVKYNIHIIHYISI